MDPKVVECLERATGFEPVLFLLGRKVPCQLGEARIILYLFITYIVTSNPKRISVADGIVHILYFPFIIYRSTVSNTK